jgi:hypothetical protein
MSTCWSVMKSFRRVGLSRWAETDVAERTLRWARWNVVGGPGLD